MFHVLVVGAVVLEKFIYVAPRTEPPAPVMTLTLVAAPAEPVETPKPVVPPPSPPKIEPVKLVPAVIPITPVVKSDAPEVTEVARPVPVAAVPPPVPVAVVTPAPTPPPVAQPPVKISGDASSPKPGPDATTTPPPLVKAEPNYLKNPEPPYPLIALRRHQEGLVLLTVKVTAQGTVEQLAVEKSSGFPALDDAALRAVRGWEFQPAHLGPLAVESEIEVPVRFQVKD